MYVVRIDEDAGIVPEGGVASAAETRKGGANSPAYERPTVRCLGTLADLTAGNPVPMMTDGFGPGSVI